MHVIVSAGNFDQNQCFGGPATAINQRLKDVGQIVAGNTDWDDKRFSILEDEIGSNYGSVSSLYYASYSTTKGLRSV